MKSTTDTRCPPATTKFPSWEGQRCAVAEFGVGKRHLEDATHPRPLRGGEYAVRTVHPKSLAHPPSGQSMSTLNANRRDQMKVHHA